MQLVVTLAEPMGMDDVDAMPVVQKQADAQVDKNTNVAEYCWEQAKQTLSVHYKGSCRILIEGIYRLQPEATGTRLSYEATIDVKIPVLGSC